MKNKIKQEKGVTLSILVITIIVLLILTSTLIYNAKGSIHIQNTTKLYNDLELLRECKHKKINTIKKWYPKLRTKSKWFL